MKALRRIILVFTITAGTYILVPLFLLLIGIYNIDDFFHRPPSARVVALHVDHNIPDEAGAPSMRVTSRIKTYNMGVNDLSIQIDFLYKDGAPILSRIDRNDIEVSQLAQSLGNDSLITVVLFVPYNVYPDECHDKRIKGKVYLSYTGQKGITVRQKQRKKISIKSLNKVINDGVINENNTSSKNVKESRQMLGVLLTMMTIPFTLKRKKTIRLTMINKYLFGYTINMKIQAVRF